MKVVFVWQYLQKTLIKVSSLYEKSCLSNDSTLLHEIDLLFDLSNSLDDSRLLRSQIVVALVQVLHSPHSLIVLHY